MYRCLVELIEGEETRTPVYCFKTHKQLPGQHRLLKSKEIIIFEGILCMHDERIRKLFDLKIFIHCDPDIALARRIRRDINERGRDVVEVLKRYNRFVKRDFDKYVKPQMKFVDFTIPGGARNDVAMNIIVQNLQSRLSELESRQGASLSTEAQLRDALCLDLAQIADSARLQCPTIEHKHLVGTYLGLLQNNDLDFVESNINILVDRLNKSALQFIGTDFGQTVKSATDLNSLIFCGDYADTQPANAHAQPQLLLFFETTCTAATVDAVLQKHAQHKGVPVYCAFVFIEKEAMERLYKHVDSLKLVCLFPLQQLTKLADVVADTADAVLLDALSRMGDAAIAARLGLRNN